MLANSLYKPIRRPKKKYHPPWYTSHIRHVMNPIQRSLNSRNSPSLHGKQKKLESNLLLEMEQAKEEYRQFLVSSFSGSLFRHLSNMISVNIIPSTIHLDGINESDPAKKCDLFNAFFVHCPLFYLPLSLGFSSYYRKLMCTGCSLLWTLINHQDLIVLAQLC